MKFFQISLLVSFFCFSAENPKKYTVGMKICNDTYAGQAINPVHMTITYLGEADAEKLDLVKQFLLDIAAMRPLQIKIGEPDTFGTKDRPVFVRKLMIENNEIEEKMLSMHHELGVCEPFQSKKHEIPTWHVSLKDQKLQEEFLAKAGTILIGGKLFIKPLGNFDPIFEIE